MATTTKSISAKVEQKDILVDPMKVEKKHLMALINYVKVDNVYNRTSKYDTKLSVTGVDDGVEFEIRGNKLIEKCLSADLWEEEIKLTQTKLAELFITLYNVPFTVCFDKQADAKTGKVEERVLRGRLMNPEPLMGRSNVEDLDITEGHNLRQVDHRTLKWIIVKGVKYLKG